MAIPDEIKIAQGTFVGKMSGSPTTTVVAAGLPEPPAHLLPEELEFWHQIVPEMARLGVVHSCDAWHIAGLCEWYVRYRKASRLLDDPASASTMKQHTRNQLTIQAGIAWDKFMALGKCYGLTCLDRSKFRSEILGNSPKVEAVAARKRV